LIGEYSTNQFGLETKIQRMDEVARFDLICSSLFSPDSNTRLNAENEIKGFKTVEA
jgi:hypothetical protein